MATKPAQARILLRTLLISLIATCAAAPALAHVRWFVEAGVAVEGFEPYSLTSPEVLIWIALATGIVGASVWLDTVLPDVRIVDSKTRHDFIEILRIFTGMSCLLTAYDGAIVAPHLDASGGFGTLLLWVQSIIGILLIANRFIRHVAIWMLLLHLGLAIKFGVIAALEYLIMPGIAVFLLINNLPTDALRVRWKPYSVSLLRIFTGISLITLGFSEKLLNAQMAETFLIVNNWNFLALIGLDWFSDRLFVLSAGVVEVVFGVILVLGTTTRLNVLAFSATLLASNVIFLVEGNREAALLEFIGHIPIMGVALILLLLGYGQTLRITNLLPHARVNTRTRTIRVPEEA
ncbi:MAG: hypothetical protein AAFY38_17080 [Pseudomonadota bacterium]